MVISGTSKRKECHSCVREGGEKLFLFGWFSKNTFSPWSLMHKELSCIYIWLHLLQEELGLQACRLRRPVSVRGISRLTFWLKTWWWRHGDSCSFSWSDQHHCKEWGIAKSFPPAPIGGTICKPLPSWAQRPWDLRGSLSQRNPTGKKLKSMKSKTKSIQDTHLTSTADPTGHLDFYLLLVLTGWYK